MEDSTGVNEYLIDLSSIETIPEIIFELSSVLDRPEAKNRRICLKLGALHLNQAQLLSIKSLINGIGSSLSSIDTKSAETEKTALSLGIIVSNVLPENTAAETQAAPYKTAEEFKNAAANQEETDDDSYTIVEESRSTETDEEQAEEKAEKPLSFNKKRKEKSETIKEELEIKENTDKAEPKEAEGKAAQTPSGRVSSELDIIFGSNPLNASIFNAEAENKYTENNVLADIEAPAQEYTKEDIEIELFPAKYIKQTIRSGQVISYEGNIIIIGDCHPGSEITALGDITVWGVLNGIAHAGSNGNTRARVRALRMNAVQLRIADCYSRRPDALNTMFAEKTNTFTPEEARIINGEIVVFKIND